MKAIKAVYSYYFPEIRKIIDEVVKNYPHEVFLKSVKPGLDDFHELIIEKYLKFQEKSVPRLKDFKYKYPTSGSSEGIFHLLAYLSAIGVHQIYVLEGEYEGYAEYSKTFGIKTVEIDLEKTDIPKLKKGIWFISNPSARNGNIISNKIINEICDSGHKVIYDLAYLGLTEPYKFDLSHKNIIAVVVSLSKSYGLFYYRVGFTFSREPITSLYANKWFKNILSLIIAEKIFDNLSPRYIFKKYRAIQRKVIDKINKKYNLGMRQSDAVLLGYLTKDDAGGLSKKQLDSIKPFKRGTEYRFCLTPYYEMEVKK